MAGTTDHHNDEAALPPWARTPYVSCNYSSVLKHATEQEVSGPSPRTRLKLDSKVSATSLIVDFYNGKALDPEGRSLDDILRLDAESFGKSTSHWKALFPVPEGLQSALSWPPIDEEVFQAFRSSEKLRGRLNDGFRKALWFFGFQMIDNEKVVLDGQVESHLSNWDCDVHRNHNRIATIIRSLRVLGLEPQALSFYRALTTSATKVRPSTLENWRKHAFLQLNIPPAHPDAEVEGKSELTGSKFLRDFVYPERAHLEDEKGDPFGIRARREMWEANFY